MPKRSVRSGKSPGQRPLRVGEVLRHALSEIFVRDMISDPLLSSVSMTVTEVRCTPDLKNALIFISLLERQDDHALPVIITALNGHSRFIRGCIGRHVTLKYVPTLKFIADDTSARAAHVDALLRSPAVMRDLI